MNFTGLKQHILERLEKELDPRLTYHNLEHTMDVYDSATRLAEMEKVNGHDLLLLQTACLLHDTGMLDTYSGHENASVELANKILPEYQYSSTQIEMINNMIMATKLPQVAHSKLEQIICDADLDYLGRNDFHMISLRLKYEWDILEFNPTTLFEWYKIQINFLSGHQYFTSSAKKLRQPVKEMHLAEIREICHIGK